MFTNLFGVANVETLEGVDPLLSVSVYNDERGSLVNNIIRPFESYEATAEVIIEAGITHIWTCDAGIYKALLKSPYVAVEMKHKSDTTDTSRAVQFEAEVLKDIYGYKRPVMKRFPRIREWISDNLIKLALLIN